jgi:hypothetical protein
MAEITYLDSGDKMCEARDLYPVGGSLFTLYCDRVAIATISTQQREARSYSSLNGDAAKTWTKTRAACADHLESFARREYKG